jgi:hypothetical protein
LKPHRIEDVRAIDDIRLRDGVCLYGLLSQDGCTAGKDVHHITHRGAGGDDSPENMILLCRKHHNMSHNGLISVTDLRRVLTHFFGFEYQGSDCQFPEKK